MAIRSEDVPEAGRPLLRLVERWGLGDDFERELAVRGASDDELADLVEVVEGIADEFWGWLVGPESDANPPSEAYVVLTVVTMAFESARMELQRRSSRP